MYSAFEFAVVVFLFVDDAPPCLSSAPVARFFALEVQIYTRYIFLCFFFFYKKMAVQAARDADDLAAWRDESPLFPSNQGQDYPSSTVMALGNSCFGSLEHPRTLSSRVHMVGPRC